MTSSCSGNSTLLQICWTFTISVKKFINWGIITYFLNTLGINYNTFPFYSSKTLTLILIWAFCHHSYTFIVCIVNSTCIQPIITIQMSECKPWSKRTNSSCTLATIWRTSWFEFITISLTIISNPQIDNFTSLSSRYWNTAIIINATCNTSTIFRTITISYLSITGTISKLLDACTPSSINTTSCIKGLAKFIGNSWSRSSYFSTISLWICNSNTNTVIK